MKKSRIIAPALGVLILSTAASITGTVAWFTANNSVQVTGMTVNTKVGSNLLIKADTLVNTTKFAENVFVSSDTFTIPTTTLEPVSTVNAKKFFYTTNAKANGDAESDSYDVYNAAEVPTSSEDTAFDAAYGTTGAKGYVDYVFQLRAVNTQPSAKAIKLTKLDMFYGGAKDGKAHRVAVLVEDLSSANAASGQSGELKGIYSIDGAANQSDGDTGHNYAVSANNAAPTQLTKDYNDVAVIASLNSNATGQYKVVVRLWLEGEDTTCTSSTYAVLNSSWSLELELKIEGADPVTAVSALTRYTTFAASNSTTYVCDGTHVFVADNNGKPTGDAVTSSGLNNAELEAELEGAFGISIA